MPKVRITAGTGTRGADLSVGLEPLQSVAEDLKARRGLEYTTKMAEYAAEGARIKLIEEQYNQDYKTALDQIMEAEKAKGGSFDANTAKTLREMAKEVANANAASSLGEKYDYTLSKEEAYETIAKNNRALDAMANNAGPLAALKDKFEKSSKLADDEIGKIKYDGSGNVADLYDVITGVANNSPLVTYEVDERGNSYYKKNINGREVKIPIEAINSIMTGENADYPFTVNADPTQSLKAVHESIPAGTYSTEDIQSDEYKEDGKIVTDKGKQILISKSKYRNEVMAKLDGILKDPKQMASFWGTIGGQGVYDPNASSNSGNGPDVARKLLTDWAEKNLLPTGDYTTQQSTIKKLPTPTGTKTTPPTPIDPKLKNKLDVNRQLAESLKGDPDDPNRKYRYGGTVVTGSSIAYHLNQSPSKPNNMEYISLQQLGIFGEGQDKNNTKKEMYFGEDWEDNPAYKELKNLYDQSIGDSPSLQGLKNVYTWDGENLSKYITSDMTLSKINDLMDDAYSITPTDKYVSPQFKRRRLATWNKGYMDNEIIRLRKIQKDAISSGINADIQEATKNLTEFRKNREETKNIIRDIDNLIDKEKKSIKSQEVIELFRQLPMPDKKSKVYGKLVNKLNAITDPARQLDIPLNKWNSMSKEQKLKEVAVLMDIDFYQNSLIRP